MTIAEQIDANHEQYNEEPRAHMGASGLGHHCERYIWLNFRWAVQPKFIGRIKRLFRRGQLEEATIIADLEAIGVKVTDTQRRVQFDYGVSGSIDGIGNGDTLLEFKTHNKKLFDDLLNNGLQKSKPMHYTQMQVYMHGTGLTKGLYFAVCKDDDRIYTEDVEYNQEHAKKAIARGQRLAQDDRLPPPISADPTWYQCKMCDAHSFCHKTKLVEHVNCRTCSNITPQKDGGMYCDKWNAVVLVTSQRIGCDSHVLHPDLVPWQRLDGPNDWTAIYLIDEAQIANGEPSEGVYSSKQIIEWNKTK
jgi:hypothetical protein